MAEVRYNPEVRFTGFSQNWHKCNLSHFVEPSKEKNTDNVFSKGDVLSVSGDFGIVNQIEFQGRSFAGVSVSNYGIVHPGYIVYTKSPLKTNPYGIIKANNGKAGIVSTLYAIYRPQKYADPNFIQCYFEFVDRLNRYLKPLVNKGAKNDMKVSDAAALTGSVIFPEHEEQQKIAELLTEFDSLITLRQRKYEKLVALKKAMLEKMFPKAGADVPEIRFSGFTDAWEQRRFSELVLIERGGSPRPIEKFITSSSDGLNWIKIGDAPNQGKYITQTAEKIKPEGLVKTREVHPGDLILSNSMSFGRPYIMRISGCIHDGWLLIRNTQSIFDLTFLCHLLGSEQMLDQYRAMAAGSTVNNLNKELVGSAIVKYPNKEEQQAVGSYLEHMDRLITLHQRELDKLKNLKQAFLQKLFVQEQGS